MEVKSSTVFLLLMFVMCILHCQGGHIFSANGAVMTNKPMMSAQTEPPEPVEVVTIKAQSDDCELSGPKREAILSLKERIDHLIAVLKQHFGDSFQLGAPTDVTRTESPPAEQTSAPDTKIDELPCSFRGRLMVHEETMSLDPCTECICHNGTVTCNIRSCRDPECPPGEAITPPGECCPRCFESKIDQLPCSLRGHFLVHEETMSLDPCTQCICQNGTVTCNIQSCEDPECPPGEAITPPGECCPRCFDTKIDQLPCFLRGRLLVHEERMSLDPCTECICENGTVTCNIQSCEDPECPPGEAITPPGECCPRCVESKIDQLPCSFRRRLLVHEETMSLDPCTQCICQNGTVTCNIQSCEDPECPPGEAITPPGECCPRCVETKIDELPCSLRGHLMVQEETMSLDPCTECRCENGTVTCNIQSCEDPECPPGEAITPPGECCPRCVETRIVQLPCSLRGRLMVHEETMSLDPCTECICQNGTVTCNIQSCEDPECPPGEAITPPGECCPRCVDPCFNVQCTPPQCPDGFVVGSTPPPGECCVGCVDECAGTVCPTLQCQPGFVETDIEGECCPECSEVFADCSAALTNGKTTSGKYILQPAGAPAPFEAVCDMVTDGGGWTVILVRDSTGGNFYRDMADYVVGFGDLDGSHWLGLENLYLLNKQGNVEILFQVTDQSGVSDVATYRKFRISNADTNYTLETVSGYRGGAGMDRVFSRNVLFYNKGAPFSARDMDNDGSVRNCAEELVGGWWYRGGRCSRFNPLGEYRTRAEFESERGIFWAPLGGIKYSLTYISMKIRDPTA
ncbi:Tenascin [Holothuria leucospilota]|uniref:Tenascin n=1 Tax=Holothuria leucospilota TaxID=206669 RepID=A0A9Q1BGZ3_HOLLE|nr:Tenascin [Holothuria leucospilota]